MLHALLARCGSLVFAGEHDEHRGPSRPSAQPLACLSACSRVRLAPHVVVDGPRPVDDQRRRLASLQPVGQPIVRAGAAEACATSE